MNIIEFAKFRKMFGDGSGGSDSGLGVIESSYVLSDYCATGECAVGTFAGNWMWDCPGYNIYGYALESNCKTLKLTGAMLDGSFTGGRANLNILFVNGFRSGFDTVAVVSSSIAVVPNEFEWDNHPTEFTITVPNGIGIDGIYISVDNHNAPVLECTEVYEDYGNIGTNVTTTFIYMSNFINYPFTEDSFSMGISLPEYPTASVFYGNVTSGTKYRVYCSPINPNNLWENFVFANDDYSTLAVLANDVSVGQYVTKVDDATFDITIPDGCEMLHINFYPSGGFSIFLLD